MNAINGSNVDQVQYTTGLRLVQIFPAISRKTRDDLPGTGDG